MFRILLIISLFSQLSFAQENTFSQLKDNVATVVWTGFDDRVDFVKSPVFVRELFCSNDGVFCVKQKNYVTIDMDANFPDGFTDKIKEAVNKIKNKENPVLIFSITSHGGRGILRRQDPNQFISGLEILSNGEIAYGLSSDITYDKLLDAVFENSFEVNKNIKLILFVDACFSGSVMPIIHNKLSCYGSKEDCPFEGIDGSRYKYKMSVYTSSLADESSLGFEFLKQLTTISKQEDCKDKEGCELNYNGQLMLQLAKKSYSTPVIWDSFSGKENKPLLSGDKDAAADALIDNNSKFHFYAAKILYEKRPKGDQAVIDALIYALKNDKDIRVRALVSETLGLVAKGGDENVIDALIDAIKNNQEYPDILEKASSALARIAIPTHSTDKRVIDALLLSIHE